LVRVDRPSTTVAHLQVIEYDNLVIFTSDLQLCNFFLCDTSSIQRY